MFLEIHNTNSLASFFWRPIYAYCFLLIGLLNVIRLVLIEPREVYTSAGCGRYVFCLIILRFCNPSP